MRPLTSALAGRARRSPRSEQSQQRRARKQSSRTVVMRMVYFFHNDSPIRQSTPFMSRLWRQCLPRRVSRGMLLMSCSGPRLLGASNGVFRLDPRHGQPLVPDRCSAPLGHLDFSAPANLCPRHCFPSSPSRRKSACWFRRSARQVLDSMDVEGSRVEAIPRVEARISGIRGSACRNPPSWDRLLSLARAAKTSDCCANILS